MKKILLFLILFFYCGIYAQVNMVLNVNNPFPYKLSALQSNDQLVNVILINPTSTTFTGTKLSVRITDETGGIVAHTNDDDPGMPRFTIPAGGSITISGKNLINFNAVTINDNIKTAVMTTNSLPEGNYDLCVKLISENGQPIGTPQEDCRTVSIRIPQPPTLIAPADLQEIHTEFPQFIWSPMTGAYYDPLTRIEYKLSVAKMLANQSPKDAIERNIKIIETSTPNSVYQVTPADISLNNYQDKNGFAWQIQSVDAVTKKPVGSNDGRSEVFSFSIRPKYTGFTLLQSPANGSIVDPLLNDDYIQFQWNDTHQGVTITKFLLKIVEVKEGQNPVDALEANTPVKYVTDIPASANSFSAGGSTTNFKNDQKYAWRVWAYSEKNGYNIDSSHVGFFTVKRAPVLKDPITLVLPEDKSSYSPEKQGKYTNFVFKWDISAVKKEIKYFSVFFLPINKNDDPAAAIDKPGSQDGKYVELPCTPNPGRYFYYSNPDGVYFSNNQRYAWLVSAFGTDGNLIAQSSVQSFTAANTSYQTASLKKITFGRHTLEITTLTNPSSDYLSGKGKIALWEGGPVLDVDFQGLKVAPAGNKSDIIPGGKSKGPSDSISLNSPVQWKVVKGYLNKNIPPMVIDLTYQEPDGGTDPHKTYRGAGNTRSEFVMTNVTFREDTASVYGEIQFTLPMWVKKGSSVDYAKLYSVKTVFSVSPANKIYGKSQFRDNYNLNLAYPDRNLVLKNGSRFFINDNILTVNMDGMFSFYEDNGTSDKYKIEFPLQNAQGFYSNHKFAPHPMYVKIGSTYDLSMNINSAYVNIYSGYIFVTDGYIRFHKAVLDISDIPFDDKSDVVISSAGINGTVSGSMNTNVKYHGFDFTVRKFNLEIKKGILTGNNYILGDMFIPFFNKKAEIRIGITGDGVTDGKVSNSLFPGGSVYTIGKDEKSGQILKFTLNGSGLLFVNSDDKFQFGGWLSLESQSNEAMLVKNIPVAVMELDSLGNLAVPFLNYEGYKYCGYLGGTYNNYNIYFDHFRFIKNIYGYQFGVKGKIVIAPDLSSDGGSDFQALLNVAPEGAGGNRRAGGNRNGTQEGLQVEPIGLSFDKGPSSFGASVKWFSNDPVYGTGFMAKTVLRLMSPAPCEADATLMIGKTDNGKGFTYWFTEAGAEFDVPIQTGVLSLAIKGFRGRLYSHMRHDGAGIGSQDYVPDNSIACGIYGEVPLLTTPDNGTIFWGNSRMEMTFGGGFSTTFEGDYYFLTPGYSNTDGMVKSHAFIYMCTSPAKFQANFSADIDVLGAVCGSGNLDMLITPDEWYLNLGTDKNPITTSLLCNQGGYNGYFMINPSSTSLGAGYSVNTGMQRWGSGKFGLYAYAEGSASVHGTMFYNPFSISAGANLNAYVEMGATGFGHDFDLISGNLGADLSGTMPDPVCFAGSVHGRACINLLVKKICIGATFKMKFKNGSFSMSSTCP